MIKKIKILSMAFLVAMVFASCSKSKTEEKPVVEGEIMGVRILTVSGSNGETNYLYQIGLDARQDNLKELTDYFNVDQETFSKCANLIQYNQPHFIRLNFDICCDRYKFEEYAIMNYDVMGTPPVYIFSSNQKIISN